MIPFNLLQVLDMFQICLMDVSSDFLTTWSFKLFKENVSTQGLRYTTLLCAVSCCLISASNVPQADSLLILPGLEELKAFSETMLRRPTASVHFLHEDLLCWREAT